MPVFIAFFAVSFMSLIDFCSSAGHTEKRRERGGERGGEREREGERGREKERGRGEIEGGEGG